LKDYIKAIEITKSPLKSADKLQGVVTMVIDTQGQSDSIEVGASWNNHEGYSFNMYFQSGQKTNSFKTNLTDYDEASNYFEIGYQSVNNEEVLILYHYNKSNQLIDKKDFTKVADRQQDGDVAWGIQYVVNEKLFTGNYMLMDGVNPPSNIRLGGDGTLTGHPDLKTYHVQTDFLGGPETLLDGLIFNLNEEHPTLLAFKTSNDTTYLYSTIGDEEAGELLQIDKIVYTLARVR
jgi:hypothetical protein